MTQRNVRCIYFSRLRVNKISIHVCVRIYIQYINLQKGGARERFRHAKLRVTPVIPKLPINLTGDRLVEQISVQANGIINLLAIKWKRKKIRSGIAELCRS